MSEDFLHRLRTSNQIPDIQFSPIVYNEALVEIEDMCLEIVNKALVQLGLPSPNRAINSRFDRDLQQSLTTSNWVNLCKQIFQNWLQNNV